MGSIVPSQLFPYQRSTALLCLLAGVVCTYLVLRPVKPASASAEHTSDRSGSTQRGVHLTQVQLGKDDSDTDIDIIAIHGLDTTSRDTWTWKDPRDPENETKWVNWLHPGMLPETVDRARIFTCDWPAHLFEPFDSVQKTIEEYALLLLEGIQRDLFGDNAREQHRPIVFIASCLGGIILAKALVHADDQRSRYFQLRTAARGIVFLATPFRGTSFHYISHWAEPGLKAWASIRGLGVSKLLDSLKGSTFDLEELIPKFTMLCQDKENPCELSSFYELKKMSLPHRTYPWLPGVFGQKIQLVNRSSASLDIICDPLPLDRHHSMMNKFRDSNCPDYKKVVYNIKGIAEKVRSGTPLQQADAWIRNEHYSDVKLQIERLSGDLLSMNQCYINLAIVEISGPHAGGSSDGVANFSQLSLFARQRVETPEESIQVDLQTMFNERKKADGSMIQPRRIWIQGRAGVGKTTLCKKIVHEFYRGTWNEWTKLFDRILWVPLRNMKLPERRHVPGYSFEHLFKHEYFSLPRRRPDLAKELANALETKSHKTLFLLDGLDEVSLDLGSEDDMSRFLKELLNQPNAIITSRPSAKPPPNLDFQLETIGFYPDQVQAYIDADPKVQPFSDKIQTFLQEHWLIQGLVRIPIQLDALCYVWEDVRSGAVPDTMTWIYEAIEQKLWKKDIIRLEKTHDGKPVNPTQIEPSDVEGFVDKEVYFLEALAFTGLHRGIIDFTSEHRQVILRKFQQPRILPHKTLPNLSFLRTSDQSSRLEDQNYHFLHLTFQEYFAARYFVRQWKNDGKFECVFKTQDNNALSDMPPDPPSFLREHKYSARYDVFWRFVVGLLDTDSQVAFFALIEDEPLDLLGPAHHRLVMHCLYEVSGDLHIRSELHGSLSEWLLFECDYKQSAQLASETEFPEHALDITFRRRSDLRVLILEWLRHRVTIPLGIVAQAMFWFEDKNEDPDIRRSAAFALGGQAKLPEEILAAITARLRDEHPHVRDSAVSVLGGQAKLPEEILAAIAAWLGDKGPNVRESAADALAGQARLPEEILAAITARLRDEHPHVRESAVSVLGGQAKLPEEILAAIAARLGDEHPDVQESAANALRGQAKLPEEILAAIAARLGTNIQMSESLRLTPYRAKLSYQRRS